MGGRGVMWWAWRSVVLVWSVMLTFAEEDYYYDDVRNSTKNYDEYSDGIIDCLSSMHLSFHELQLFRIHQERYKNNHNKINNNNNNINSPNNNNNNNNIDNDGYINDDDDDDGGGGYEMRSLLLGDIHTEVSERESYRSLAFQDALLQVEVGGACGVMVLIMVPFDEYDWMVMSIYRIALFIRFFSVLWMPKNLISVFFCFSVCWSVFKYSSIFIGYFSTSSCLYSYFNRLLNFISTWLVMAN